jgi:hypothetical protein
LGVRRKGEGGGRMGWVERDGSYQAFCFDVLFDVK